MKIAWFCLLLLTSCTIWQSKPPDPEQQAKKIWRQSNLRRRQYHKSPLKWNKDIAQLAQRYSRDMSERKYFSHIDPEGRNIADRLLASGISFCTAGENLANSNQNAQSHQIVKAWLTSPSHKKALLDKLYNNTGVGVYYAENGKCYITQIFIETYRK